MQQSNAAESDCMLRSPAPRARPKLFLKDPETFASHENDTRAADVETNLISKSDVNSNGISCPTSPPSSHPTSISHFVPSCAHSSVAPNSLPKARPPPPLVQAIRPSQLKILEKIGRGASGCVFKAEWQDCMCALKVPHERSLQESVHTRTLIQEAAVLSSIRHPNVVSCFGSVVDVGRNDSEVSLGIANTQQLLWHQPLCGILLEYCNGGSLRHLISSSDWDHISWRQRLRWALDAATGLAFLHEREVVHRDIKSPNLLLMDGRLKVADFGLARFFTSSAGASTAKTVGSPAWMAPEVITNGTHISPPSDIYSFGVVLWEIMTGQIPWQSCTSMHIVYQVACKAARPPLPSASLPSQLPQDYIGLIEDCWQRAPERRPTCAGVVLRLRQMLQDQDRFVEQEMKGMYM